MSIRHAMLGLLCEQADYGYHLKQRFEERVGEVWRLNLGQVYQTLRSLERDGLIHPCNSDDELPDDDQAAARRCYQLTPKGKRSLEAWLQRKPASPRPLRDELLIRLLVLEPNRRADALERIDAQEQLYRRHLIRLLARKRRISDTAQGVEFVAGLGLEAAILHTRAHLRWLEHCRERIRSSDVAASHSRAESLEKQPGQRTPCDEAGPAAHDLLAAAVAERASALRDGQVFGHIVAGRRKGPRGGARRDVSGATRSTVSGVTPDATAAAGPCANDGVRGDCDRAGNDECCANEARDAEAKAPTAGGAQIIRFHRD